VSEGLVQAGVDRDQTVQGGQGDEAADLGPVTVSLTWQPSVRARLCAPIRVCRPAESQNRVRVMSTTTAGPGAADAWSRAPAAGRRW
jgi:hypothetical protein